MATTVHPLIGAPSARHREGSFTWVSQRRVNQYDLLTGPAEELAFEGLEPYEGKLSCTVLRGALGWQQPGPTRWQKER